MFDITRKCATVDVSVNNVIQIRRTLKNKKNCTEEMVTVIAESYAVIV